MFRYAFGLFGRFELPLIYTPDDNEWTDCHRVLAGRFHPIERLQRLRQMFFADDYSLSQIRLKLTRRSSMPSYEAFVENAIWSRGGAQFATVHVVGSGNNYSHHLPDRGEYMRRNAANIAWLDHVFAQAAAARAWAVVLFMHAAPLFWSRNDRRIGFVDTQAAFARHAQNFGKPLLLVHGDSHEYKFDRPLRADPIGHAGPRLNNF
ncbi:MAG: hypothetical protein FJX52_08010 [Alphaproteobacteria bacterium]|nr:hypothetical protein [Alphaproteobacteria bacterium]